MKGPKKIILKNGLRIMLVPQPENLAATVLILVKAGSEYETKRQNGVSHFLEHLMFKGTTDRPEPGMIAHELTALGAQFNAFTGEEYTGYYAKAQAEKLPKILEIVSDLYLNPLFDEAEIEKERGVIIQEINMYEDDLPSRVQRDFSRLVYGDQPAGWDVSGEKPIIKRLSRADFAAYRGERYVMPGTVVVVAGKFGAAATLAQIKRYFGALPRRTAPAKKKTVERQSAPRITLHFKESDQAHLVLGFRAFDMFDERRYALRVLADLLGGGMSSRLFVRIREKMGAAYYIGAGTDLSLDHGLLSISAGVDRKQLEAVIAAILEECKIIRDSAVPEKELQKAKDHMIGGLILGLETSDDLASFYGGQEVLTGAVLSPAVLADKIKKVTARDVTRVAKAILKNKGLNLAVVGPYKNQAPFKKILRLRDSGK
ncbi:MAG TPA: pitrilysin family protein [Candidatus Paceibacterota bacterium]|nr:pitrilysin family protein [Candidatus Paceibacterota bacterium]